MREVEPDGQYLPDGASQLSHTALTPAPALYFPGLHSAQAEEPAVSEYVPAEHGVQIAATEEVDPSWPYLPAAHKDPEHVEAKRSTLSPANCWYVPAGHNKQVAADADVAPVCPYFPAEQRVPEQVVEKVAPTTSEYVPEGQWEQADRPVYSIYVPAGHNMQVAADADVAPRCPYFPAEQRVPVQVQKAMAPTTSEYVPEGQWEQADPPVYIIYVPAGHNMQVASNANVTSVCPYFPAEQGVPEQVVKEMAPTTSEYVPEGQFQHRPEAPV